MYYNNMVKAGEEGNAKSVYNFYWYNPSGFAKRASNRINLQTNYLSEVLILVTLPSRLKNVRLTVAADEAGLNDNDDSFCAYRPGEMNKYYTVIPCISPKIGRWGQLKMMAGGYLNLYEVEIHGEENV